MIDWSNLVVGLQPLQPIEHMSSDNKAVERDCGVVKRLARSLEYDRRELSQEISRATQIESTGDAARLKQQQSVVAEAEMMIPFTEKKIKEAIAALEAKVAKGGPRVSEENQTKAAEVIAMAKSILEA
ncbi:tubulin binding cofactor A [Kipferlia bialata]|uniref:Tubulin-specific chaperone A n=1 Tax=Kipferlia bialata TaxID=797122 RepID=A0A9K3CWC7_9EUKA|nr:tubulin binding cofactor A [Kipferlia bialata]|eukprot:g5251.t1